MPKNKYRVLRLEKIHFRSKIFDVRDLFKARFALLSFAENYSHYQRFAKTNWLCKCGSARELEDHLRSGQCEVYWEIRSKYDNGHYGPNQHRKHSKLNSALKLVASSPHFS